MTFNKILIYTTKLKETREFYGKLGFTAHTQNEHVVDLQLGSFTLQLMDKADAEELQIPNEELEKHKPLGMYFYVETEDVDMKHTELVALNLQPSSSPKDWPWGQREFAIKDPNGYILIFYKKLEESKS